MNIKMANVMGSPLNSGPLTGGRRNTKTRNMRKGKKNAKKTASRNKKRNTRNRTAKKRNTRSRR